MRHESYFIAKITFLTKDMPKWKRKLLDNWFNSFTCPSIAEPVKCLFAKHLSEETLASIRAMHIAHKTYLYRSVSNPNGTLHIELSGRTAAIGKDFEAFLELFKEDILQVGTPLITYRIQQSSKVMYIKPSKDKEIIRDECLHIDYEDKDKQWHDICHSWSLNVSC